MHSKVSSAMAAWLTMSSLWPVAALSQESTAAASHPAAAAGRAQDRLEEIIVTARKKEESMQSVPVSVTAFTPEDIERRSMANLKDIGRFAPNVYFSTFGVAAPSSAAIFIRGVGESEQMITGDPGVGLYVDGVYVGRSQGAVTELLDLERIEVLRGPQGTLFGKNSVGGVINLVSRAPRGDDSGKLSLTVGNQSRLDIAGSTDVPLGEHMAASLSGLSKGRGCTYRRASDGACYGSEDTRAGRVYLRYAPTEDFTADLIVDVTHSQSTSIPTSILAYNLSEPGPQDYNARVLAGTAPGPLLSNSNPEVAPFKGDGNSVTESPLDVFAPSLHLKYQLGDVLLHSISSYRTVKSRGNENSDGSAAQYVEVQNTAEANQITQELRADGVAFANRLDYVAGLYFFRESGNTNENILVPYIFDALGGTGGWSNNNYQVSRSYAGFIHSSTELVKGLRLTADIRYTKDQKSFSGGRKSITSAIYDQVPYTTTDASWKVWTPKFGLDWQVTDSMLLYTSASKGYRAGGFNGRSATVLAITTPYDPEYVWTYEAGFKSQLLDDRVRFNFAAFTSDYRNRQQTILKVVPGTTTFAPVVANAAKVRIKGLEAELVAKMTAHLRLEAALGITDAKFTEISPAVTDITLTSVVPYVPRTTGSMALEYSYPVTQLRGDISARIDGSYRSKVSFAPDHTDFDTQGGLGLLNARLAYASDSGRWDVALYGRNLANKTYKVWANDLYNTAFGIAFAAWGERREGGVTFTRHFGSSSHSD